ncbi:MAG: AarF/ABC1/UbiB kinase family protein [Deltaproteobacteria bacterium]|nr:AarF/ABC1/UbiB kinase family protein [Deltaproteobacteria bacterium]
MLRPFPLPLPTPDGRDLRRRTRRIVTIAARTLGPPLARRVLRRPLGPQAFARPLRRLFESLGVTFVKFGQLVASSPGVFGDAVADEFRSCLDTGPLVPLDDVRTAVATTLGRPLAEVFARFDPAPIGRASIAVVHRAALHDGREVAVKVLRPGIETTVATDLRLMGPLLDVLAFRVGIPEAGQLVRMLDGFREQLAEELDLRNEARAMEHHRDLARTLRLERIVVPAPYPELSGQRALVMDFLDGVPIDDVAGMARLGLDARPLLGQLVRAWFITALRDGTFHADAHAGNILVLRDGRVGVVDWGIVGRLDARTRRFLRRTVEGALGDESAWGDIADEFLASYGPALIDGLGLDRDGLAAFSRSVVEPMLTRPFGEVSLGKFLAAWQGNVAAAEGRPRERPTWRRILARLKRQRAMHVGVARHGGRGTEFDRGTFLLGKQLLYFERYGKMFLGDTSLLADRAFFEELLRTPAV